MQKLIFLINLNYLLLTSWYFESKTNILYYILSLLVIIKILA
jgi:hypothetical protein